MTKLMKCKARNLNVCATESHRRKRRHASLGRILVTIYAREIHRRRHTSMIWQKVLIRFITAIRLSKVGPEHQPPLLFPGVISVNIV